MTFLRSPRGIEGRARSFAESHFVSLIRLAGPQDIHRLREIDATTRDDPRGDDYFADACRATHDVQVESGELALVLEDRDRVTGFVMCVRVLDEVSIHDIAIDASEQGRGLGRRLLQVVLERFRDAGASRCLLEVRASNQVALRLYRSCQFHLDGVRKNYYPVDGGREDALLMSRAL